jgi:hypothetical protein
MASRRGPLARPSPAGLLRLGAFALLAAGALALLLVDGAAPRLAGLARLREPAVAALDAPGDADDREAPRFLSRRDRLTLVVPRDMAAGELLRLYQIDFPHVRRQIARQEGLAALPVDHRLAAGARYEVTLTPPAEDVP